MDINYKIIRSHKTHTNDLLAVRLEKNNKDAIGYFNLHKKIWYQIGVAEYLKQ